MNNRIRMAALASAVLSCVSGLALGQAYPSKPIKVLTASPGGALDVVIRSISDGVTGTLGQPFVVDNRPSNQNPLDAFSKAPPDGYQLAYYANSIWVAPFIRENIPYDPLKDFSPVSLTVMAPNVLVVNSGLPVNSVKELVAYAKAKPGELNMYFAPSGDSIALATVLFETQAGVKTTHINYKVMGTGFTDLAAGRINAMFPTLASARAMISAGKIKILAVTSAKRSSLAPDIPTLAEQGYQDYESINVNALIAPGKTPAAVVNRLNQEVVKFLNLSDTKTKMAARGFEVVASSPAELAAFMQSESSRIGKAFKEAGIKPSDWTE